MNNSHTGVACAASEAAARVRARKVRVPGAGRAPVETSPTAAAVSVSPRDARPADSRACAGSRTSCATTRSNAASADSGSPRVGDRLPGAQVLPAPHEPRCAFGDHHHRRVGVPALGARDRVGERSPGRPADRRVAAGPLVDLALDGLRAGAGSGATRAPGSAGRAPLTRRRRPYATPGERAGRHSKPVQTRLRRETALGRRRGTMRKLARYKVPDRSERQCQRTRPSIDNQETQVTSINLESRYCQKLNSIIQ